MVNQIVWGQLTLCMEIQSKEADFRNYNEGLLIPSVKENYK